MSIPKDFNDRMLSLGLARVAEQAAIAYAIESHRQVLAQLGATTPR